MTNDVRSSIARNAEVMTMVSVGPSATSAIRSESDIRVNYFDPTRILSASNAITSGGHQAVFSIRSGIAADCMITVANGKVKIAFRPFRSNATLALPRNS